MEPPERIARDLAKQLVVVGIPVHPDPAGSGAHWQVDVGPIGPLALVIHCFWYNRNMAGLMLGMNRANQRVGLDAPCETRPSPTRDRSILSSRERATRAWMAGLGRSPTPSPTRGRGSRAPIAPGSWSKFRSSTSAGE